MLLGAILLALWFGLRYDATPAAPEALWRNGIIVSVRHCDQPADQESLLKCASFYCAQRVTETLTNAKQATLKVTAQAIVDGRLQISGDIIQSLRARTLPTGFSCDLRNMTDAKPEFIFARRNVSENEFKAETARQPLREMGESNLFLPPADRH